MKNKKRTVLLIVLFFIGLAILMYPLASNCWNKYRANRVLTQYEKSDNSLSIREKKEQRSAAEEYNKKLIGSTVPDAFSVREGVRNKAYEKLLNENGSGVMAEIEIPCIRVDLPVYHYTFEKVLAKGAGHLPGSSLPIGGKSTHAVIVAHRGLPSMKLFTDLNLVKKKDHFYIHVLGNIHEYEVDQILTVKPKDTGTLAITKGRDYVTLVTCTPYGVNTKRLLVRGHRVPYNSADRHQDKGKLRLNMSDVIQILCAIAGLALAYLIVRLIRRKDRKQKRE